MSKLRVLAVGLGNMGMSHAKAYARIDGYQVVAVCERNIARRALPPALQDAQRFAGFDEALAAVKPDVVSISTWSDSHAEYAIKAMEAGAHVFVEKPLADTVEDAERVVAAAKKTGRKLVIGYILRHHPSWTRFIELAKTLGTPLVFRMNLNQQSSGKQWEDHKKLLQSLSPIVDCGVHYLDVMCQITRARATRVHALGARLTDGMPGVDLPKGMYNYGMLQVAFEDGSIGWYEAGWGPMMSETAFFVKDVIGPKGSVSIVVADEGSHDTKSADINTHTKTNRILLHHADLAPDGSLAKKDETFDTHDEPSHDDLCEREQRYLLKAIRENVDLSDHMSDAVRSLRIALAADHSVRTGKPVEL
ncbi:MAG TPA: Gfo/Idh/MocA family oxidoreductase [Dongiaceae bacterium]|jgi:predicted dehydrogenase|nr:Gfo/Idh/MocA family oxidoreductase [Dongiaceae bacterium]